MVLPRAAPQTARVRAACLAAGCAFAAVAPPWRHAPLAILGLLSFAWARVAVPPSMRGTGTGFAFGLGANLVGLAFVPDVVARFTPLGRPGAIVAWLLLAAAQALAFALATGAAARLERAGCPSPLALALSLYLASFVPTLFPWSLAAPFAEWPLWLQGADTIGVRGCGALLALFAGLVASSATTKALAVARRLTLLALAIALAVAVAAFGHVRSARVEGDEGACARATVALVQTSTRAEARWQRGIEPNLLATLRSSTERARARGADLVVWPETAYPYVLSTSAARAPLDLRDPRPEGGGPPILMGLETRSDRGVHNSALMVAPDGSLGPPQHKLHLLWFGEVVPFADRFPWIARTFARGTGLIAGDAIVLQRAGAIRAAVLNCYEDTLVSAGVDAARAGANLLVNISNDAWFDDGHASELHATLARARAIETRMHLVRAVNRGATIWIDARGEVRGRTLAPTIGDELLATPALCEARATPYARYGDLPFGALLTLAVAAAIVMAGRMAKAPTPRGGAPWRS